MSKYNQSSDTKL